MRPVRLIASLALVALVASPALAANNTPKPSTQKLPTTTITVSAAASLTNVFPVIATAFSKRYPNITVQFNFGPSNGLVEQIRAGAPVDVIATADETSMQRATSDGLTRTPILFARNTMMIAVPKGNPARVRNLSALQQPSVKVAVCNPQVPCGRLAAQLFDKNSMTVNPVTREVDVRGVIGKVIAGEVDAGVVYATDVRAFPRDVDGVVIPATRNVLTNYPIARVADSRKPQAGQAFIDYVRNSSSAQQILRAWGFSKPW